MGQLARKSGGSRHKLRAPFPWFGGKSRVSHIVWERFGDVPNYVEPFAGSLAVLLGRPPEWPARNETVNDLDCYIANFWRALRADPDAVAAAADWPVNEADLHARHRWLHALEAHAGLEPFRERLHTEADFHDATVAGIWVWGISAWIGDGWCRTTSQRALPFLNRSQGIHKQNVRPCNDKKRPRLGAGERGANRKRPNLSVKGGAGVHANRAHGKRPSLNNVGEGVHKPSVGRLSEKMPRCDRNYGVPFNRGLHAYMRALADRLRYVRVCCGQWDRILGPSPTWKIGTTAVFLDPPYGDADRDKVYSHDSLTVSAAVRDYCLASGDNPKLRIALCGYEGEHESLEAAGWSVVAWKAGGGYGAQNKKNQNAARERIWFSPHCLRPEDMTPLLTGLDAEKGIQ